MYFKKQKSFIDRLELFKMDHLKTGKPNSRKDYKFVVTQGALESKFSE
jgi:hypothetical protein